MSDHLIHVFIGDTPIHLSGESQAQDEPALLWKVVLRTGTWKLRPGPGGVKLKAPLKIYRDKAPKGHISMAELKANFDAGAKEYVTIPQVHADGTTSDGGFVKKLIIQDVKGEDGSKTKESLLWAGMEITDSALKTKLDEKSIRGVSGGILFDYERTEDAKKFGQILSHVMVTNSPWINGTGDFQSKLPEGVMAAEPDDLPIGEVEFESRETEAEVELPVVTLADPPATEPPDPGKATNKVVWKPEQGLEYVRGRVRAALDYWRKQTMASIPAEKRYEIDWPYFSVSDVSLTSEEAGTALISSGYGSECDTWVASFKFNADREVEIDPFTGWTPAKQEWVAASENEPAPAPQKKPPARPAGRVVPPAGPFGLQEAQAARSEHMKLGNPSTTTGGQMSRISDLLSRSDLQLSDEDREVLLAEERRLAGYEESESQRRERERRAEVTAYCGTADGTTEGLLDKIGLGDPGVKKYVSNALLSDDGGPAIELSEHLADGQKTAGVPKTATDLLKGFIDILPKKDDGRVSLAEQARRLPDDPKPPAEKDEKKSPKDSADALLAELQEQGLAADLNVPQEA